MDATGLLHKQFGVSVLGGFRFSVLGEPITDLTPDLSHGSRRLLALLALRERAVARAAIAGTLWPEASEFHAHASLRSELSRLDAYARLAIHASAQELALAADVFVDIRQARLIAHRLIEDRFEQSDLSQDSIHALSLNLLPDWYDDWAVVESEEWRQLRLHALDVLAERLLAAGRHAQATDAALAAIRAEPLRETAHAALIRVLLAEGNQAEALAAYTIFRNLIRRELGLEPSPAIKALVSDLTDG